MELWTRWLAAILLVTLGATGLFAEGARADDDDDDDDPVATRRVDCDAGGSIQAAVDRARGPATVFVTGNCTEDVRIAKDDITLSGNPAGAACDKSDPGASTAGTVNGTVVVKSVRARIEFLRVTGPGRGIRITDRAAAELHCNDVSDNEAVGVTVQRASSAELTDNTIAGNGTRAENPFIFFDVGLLVLDNAAVRSSGNTYRDNQYAAIEVDRQATFRNGDFLPREPGNPADPEQRDLIVQKGADPASPESCLGGGDAIAVEIFNDGLVDVRNLSLCGSVLLTADSSFRVDGDAEILGNISNLFDSLVRLQDRSSLGDRGVTYRGTLTCDSSSQDYFSSVECNQTCFGAIPATCAASDGSSGGGGGGSGGGGEGGGGDGGGGGGGDGGSGGGGAGDGGSGSGGDGGGADGGGEGSASDGGG